jgi:hypothetical protein
MDSPQPRRPVFDWQTPGNYRAELSHDALCRVFEHNFLFLNLVTEKADGKRNNQHRIQVDVKYTCALAGGCQ